MAGRFLILTLSYTLMFLSGNLSYAGEENSNGKDCAKWKKSIEIDQKYIEKLGKKVSGDSSGMGDQYSSRRLIYIMGSAPDDAMTIIDEKRDRIEKTDEGKINLKKAELQGFDLEGINLSGSDLYKADLSGANLEGADLSGANLSKANLEGANLNMANLDHAILDSASLKGASLCGASLTYAELEDVVMEGAYLKNARLDGAKNPPEILYEFGESILKLGLIVPKGN